MAETQIHRQFLDPVQTTRKNVIDNSCFDVWQRGTSFANIGNTVISADRWYNHSYFVSGSTGAPQYLVTRETDVPTTTEAGIGLAYSLKYKVTTPQPNSGDQFFRAMLQYVFGLSYRRFLNRSATVSFWVKASQTGTYSVTLGARSNYSMVATYTINSADTWEKKSVTFDPFTEGGNLIYHGYQYSIELRFNFNTTTSLVSVPDTMGAGSKYGSTSDVYWGNTTNAYIQFTGIQLEEGKVATALEVLPWAEEYANCQMHCQKSYLIGADPGAVTPACALPIGFDNNLDVGYGHVAFPVKMFSTPTVSVYNPTNGTAGSAWWYAESGGGSGASGTCSVGQKMESGFDFASGGSQPSPFYEVSVHWLAETGY